MRIPALVVALALTVAPLAGIALSPADQGQFSTVHDPPTDANATAVFAHPLNNTTTYLTINQSHRETTRTATVTLDVAGSVTLGENELQGEFDVQRFDSAYQNASDPGVVVDTTINHLVNRTSDLRTRQRVAIEAYNEGTLSTQAFLRELAVIAVKAEETRKLAANVAPRASGWQQDRVVYIEKELETLSGPVRTRITQSLAGNPNAPGRYYVETSERGVVLATIDDQQYIREAYIGAARNDTNTTGISTARDARDIVSGQIYTWAASHLNGSRSFARGDLYSVSYDHTHGTLNVYLDKSSGKVFYEDQSKNLAGDVGEFGVAPTRSGPENESGSVALDVRLTHPSGQMLVRLTDADTGDPINGSVVVGNETVGNTGEDGELYVLQPRLLTTIRANVDGTTVSVTVGRSSSPVRTPPEPDVAARPADEHS